VDLTALGLTRNSGRIDFLAEAANIEDLPHLISLPCPRFVMLLAYNEHQTPSRLTVALTGLASAGCVYLCAWGPGCEHVHDTMDDVLEQELDGSPEQNIRTTWHSTESLEQAAMFSLEHAEPDTVLRDGCGAIRQGSSTAD
jgi:hypothetical protein